MLCVDNYAANVTVGTLYTLLVGQTAWLKRQHGPHDRTQSLESRPHEGGGRVSLESRAGSGEEGLPPPPINVGRALVLSSVSAWDTVPKTQANDACGNNRSQSGRQGVWFSLSCRGVPGCQLGPCLPRGVE